METILNSRSLQLTPLSREHSAGMEFVLRIRQAIGKRIPVDRISDYVRWFWKNHIRPHFFQEEKILLPYMPVGHVMAKRLQDEHAYIRDLILSIDHHADRQTINELCHFLEKHIRFEEQEFFGYLEQHLVGKELDNIYRQLEEHPVGNEEWKEIFWKE